MKFIYFVVIYLLASVDSFTHEKKSLEHEMNPPLSQLNASSIVKTTNNQVKSVNNMKSNINLKTDQMKPLNSTLDKKIEMPVTQINSLNTQIFISKNKCSANIQESVVFSLSNGVFNSITRRISLDGSADSISGFKLASSDVILKEARIVKNCYHDNAIIDHPYVCIVAVFEEENLIGKNKIVEIEYNFQADNIIKTKKKPFSNDNKQEDNVLIWIYDNYQATNPISKVNLKIHFDEKIKSKEIITYPEKYFKKKNEEIVNIIEWEKDQILPNSYQNFSFHIPKFNGGCKNLNEIHFELNYYSILQFFMCFLILLIFVFVIAFIYINEKEKSESIKLSEEIDNFKKLNNPKSEVSEQAKSDGKYRNN